MTVKDHPGVSISVAFLQSLRDFPLAREVEHCGESFSVAPFDHYATCPRCGARIKVRSFSGGAELEDVFDAVFEWLNRPQAERIARDRRAVLSEES
jgi:hypothetical protein